MEKVLYASAVVEKETKSLIDEIAQFKKKHIHPKLAIILVGNNPASLLYTKNKKIFCDLWMR